VDLDQQINERNLQLFDIKNSLDLEQLKYYYTYFKFLKDNGYFETPKFTPLEKMQKYNAEEIKYHLTNTDQISFEITDACNLRCKYCGYGEFYSGYDKREGKKIDFDNAKALLDYIVDLKKSVMNVKTYRNIGFSFYGGEPLLNFPFIEKMVNYANTIKLHYNKFLFQMTTNGLFLDKYMDFIINHDFALAISLDGNKEHNAYRVLANGKPSFDKLTKNIELLKNKNPEYFEKNVEFISVLHDKNEPYEVRDFFMEKYNKIPRLLPLANYGVREEKKEEFESLKNGNNTKQKISNKKDFGDLNSDRFIKTYCGYTYSKTSTLTAGSKNQRFVSTGTCHPFEKSVFLTVNGKILPCERIPQKYGLGLVKEKKVELNYQKVAEFYNGLYSKLKDKCNVCERSDECLKCIFHLDLNSTKPECSDFLNKEQFKRRTTEILSSLELDPKSYQNVVGD
jgi:uncharacterized protein